MDGARKAVVEAIHASPTQAVIYLSGGASQALGWLMSVPGASSTVLEAVVPYSRMSMVQLLGKVPASFAAQETSDNMALLAYNRALKLSTTGIPVSGIGFTGALASNASKRGEHRCYVSARTSQHMWRSNIILSKGLRNREEEDTLSSQLLLKGIATACNVSMDPLMELQENEIINEFKQSFDEDQELEQLISGQICMKVYSFDKGHVLERGRRVILSGSFNPLHDGHARLLEIASSIYENAFSCYEISAINADKPPLTLKQIKDRVKQFEAIGKTIIITNQPYFYKKAELLPDSTFIIGADTVARVVDPKYYGDNYERMLEVLLGVKQLGCNFLVAGRNVGSTFKVLADFDIPVQLEGMFSPIPETLFRMDISSTEIREKLH
ncbi:hypothetical protein SUGI_0056560 [Cryptomeria japonica]|uniref:uncharacterized protein LOC131064785 n=1 Tax=Cryptomeria japonica TaxID=3369 RepID=UPI002408B72B|nr:uncharacterized protein LOC131064785 [Cryptomeria japonica]GLJ07051.1 hypothetical protein SUGI_0056560 [Cryptomeria japonica]